MTRPIFDQALRQIRRARAGRMAGDDFLRTRAMDECLDRLHDIRRAFADVLVIGGDVPPDALPGATITIAREDELARLTPAAFDLCLSIGELETADDVTAAAFTRRHLLRPGGLLIGAIVGGNSLPRLRHAMLTADRATGAAAPRFHPTIDGPSLSALLTAVGLIDPIVDLDRVQVSYAGLEQLVGDLRRMGCTNILAERSPRPLSRRQIDVARRAFLDGQDRAIERFDLLHFAAWAPAG